MLGPQPTSEEGSAHSGMSSPSFFNLYPALQPFLQGALESAATDLHDATLLLHPSLYPVLTLLAKLQPGAEEQTRYDVYTSKYININVIYCILHYILFTWFKYSHFCIMLYYIILRYITLYSL